MRAIAFATALALSSGGAVLAESLALTDARVIDGTGTPSKSARTILVVDGMIAGVFADGSQSLPGGVTVLDIGGRSVVPGLIDGHVHLNRSRSSPRDKQPEDLEAQLAALLRSGVTSVRELAGDARLSGELARRQMQGEIKAPRIYYSAVLYGPAFLEDPRVQGSQQGMSPGTAPWSRAVTANSDIVEVVAEARSAGATGVKLYASLDASLLDTLTAEAHRQGLKAWAHSVIFPAGPSEVVAAGVDSIIHSRGLIAEGRSDIPDTFAAGVPMWISRLDFRQTDPQAPRFLRLFSDIKSRGIVFEPALFADGDPARGSTGDWRDEMRIWSCKITEAAYSAGVTISAGTDTAAVSGALQRELERLVECGLPPLDAVRAATLNNAKALGIDSDYGTVEPGKVADLLVVDGDPETDISAISNVHIVMQDGRQIVGPGSPD